MLDFGSGSGHGSAQISHIARSVIGVDVDAAAVTQAQADFSDAANVSFQTIPPVEDAPLPFEDGRFDVVISNQVIEHVPDPGRYLAEARRVLRPGGVLFIATPDRTHRLGTSQKPWNRFHLHEFAPQELGMLTEEYFRDVSLHAMDGRPDLIARETRRVRRLARLTRPFTFSNAPEVWRQAGLRALKMVNSLREKVDVGKAVEIDFGHDDIWIAAHAEHSPNIVLRAQRD